MLSDGEIFAACQPPDGFVFLGWYLPAVKMVFATPTRGLEDRFLPVFVRA